MKATIKFDLSDAHDNNKLQHMLKATDYYLALSELDRYLADRLDDLGDHSVERIKAFDDVTAKLLEILNELSIEL